MRMHYSFSHFRRFFAFFAFSFIFTGLCIALSIYLGQLLGVGSNFPTFFAKIVFFKKFYLELFVVAVLMSGCRLENKFIRLACIGFAVFITVVWTVQLGILWYSDNFLTVFLLENIGSISLVINKTNTSYFVLFTGIVSIVFLLSIYFFKKISQASIISNVVIISSLIISAFIGDNNLYKSPNRIIRDTLKISQDSPVASLALLTYDIRDLALATAGEVDAKVRELIRVNDKSEYPMINKRLYQAPFPFPVVDNKNLTQSPPNVIVFFVEALSARKLSPYKDAFAADAPSSKQGLTPNIENFSHESMVVDQYFSHTYSTFRGLRGQNCSMFPYYGGASAWALPQFSPPEGPYDCLPHQLTRNGYETIFWGPDYWNHCQFTFQTKQMGFERNIYRQEIEKIYLKRRGISRLHLTDQELMTSLISLLKEKDANPDGKPFYIASYPKGGHVGMNSEKDGSVYGDGMNRVYNTIYSWDAAFGYFWAEFKKLNLSNNTIFILTGDHSHYPERAYIEIAGSDFDRRSFDKLGLFIYSPFHNLSARYNAKNSTSLGFAPMVTQMVGLNPESQNSFLGTSPFDTKKYNLGVGWANNTLFFVDANGKSHYFDLSKKQGVQVRNLWHAIKLTHLAELNGKMTLPASQTQGMSQN